MAVEEEAGGGDIPEWVVTFGDMMSLLLTFFIMLVSMSEIKQEERFQAMVESMRQRFGYDRTLSSMVPGRSKPRNSAIARLATAGRAKRLDTLRGGDKIQAPVGDFPRVRIVRPGSQTTIGGVVFFPPDEAELTEEGKDDLRRIVREMTGKPQIIEVRGHTAPRPPSPGSPYRDNWELAYARCQAVFQFLTEQLEVDRRRIRISIAGPNEPLSIEPDAEKQKLNSRVEVFMLDETIQQFIGTKDEQQQRFTEENPTPSSTP